MFLLPHIYHDHSLLDKSESNIVLGVSELQCDMRAASPHILHIQQTLSVLDISHNTVNYICTGILLGKKSRYGYQKDCISFILLSIRLDIQKLSTFGLGVSSRFL